MVNRSLQINQKMAASVPRPSGPRSRAKLAQDSQTLHSQKLFRLRPGGQTSGLDAQLHPARAPPLPLCAAGAGSGDPPSPQNWPPPGRSALSGGTSFAKGVPPPAPLVPRSRPPQKPSGIRLATCCIADWQSAGAGTVLRTADCQSAIRQTASLRYGSGVQCAKLGFGEFSPWPSPSGEGTGLFRVGKSHRMMRRLPRWKTASLSSGERAGVRAVVSSR